jgi:hypothetical protein
MKLEMCLTEELHFHVVASAVGMAPPFRSGDSDIVRTAGGHRGWRRCSPQASLDERRSRASVARWRPRCVPPAEFVNRSQTALPKLRPPRFDNGRRIERRSGRHKRRDASAPTVRRSPISHRPALFTSTLPAPPSAAHLVSGAHRGDGQSPRRRRGRFGLGQHHCG